MTELLQRIEQNIQERRLLKRGQAVLVAVSGGLDSMTLLEALHALSMRNRWKLTVAHFNHQLRGQSSDDDEKLVRKAAAALKLPFVVGRADVRKFADQSRLSIEMAARKLRHEFLAQAASERKISIVALAHHADDQVELFFLRLLRGAGSEGLAGMKWRSASPVNQKIMLIRPLLDATKTELRVFVRESRVPFSEDATNAGLDMPRNRVRNELLPLLRRRYQPALAKAILRLMDIIGEESNFVAEAARKWLKAGRVDLRVSQDARQRVSSGGHFMKLPPAVQRRVLQLQLAEFGTWADFDLIERLRRAPDVYVNVSPNFSIARNLAGRLNLRAQSPGTFNVKELTVNLDDRAGEVDFAGVRFQWRVQGMKRPMTLSRRRGREFFDADKVGRRITLRHWRAGDRFQPIGLKSAAKLQDLFTNQKIPRAQRHELVVAESADGAIFWVQSLRIAERFKLTPGTKRRLVWSWQCRSR